MLRMLLPLMKSFRNVYLAIGSDYTAHRGIEMFVAAVGAKPGFPEAESMAAITQLMYAEITDEQKRLIGAGNLKRLIAREHSNVFLDTVGSSAPRGLVVRAVAAIGADKIV